MIGLNKFALRKEMCHPILGHECLFKRKPTFNGFARILLPIVRKLLTGKKLTI